MYGVPAGAWPVASVPPVQHVLKHCGAHNIIIIYVLYTHADDPKQS